MRRDCGLACQTVRWSLFEFQVSRASRKQHGVRTPRFRTPSFSTWVAVESSFGRQRCRQLWECSGLKELSNFGVAFGASLSNLMVSPPMRNSHVRKRKAAPPQTKARSSRSTPKGLRQSPRWTPSFSKLVAIESSFGNAVQSEKCSVKSAKWECKADATTRCRSFILHFALNTSHLALSLAVALASPVSLRQILAGVFDMAVLLL